jgi:hypothetical protein
MESNLKARSWAEDKRKPKKKFHNGKWSDTHTRHTALLQNWRRIGRAAE